MMTKRNAVCPKCRTESVVERRVVTEHWPMTLDPNNRIHGYDPYRDSDGSEVVKTTYTPYCLKCECCVAYEDVVEVTP